MLQDTALGGAFLAHERQADLRRAAARSRRHAGLPSWLRRERRPRRNAIRFRPAAQPSFIVQPRPAQLRKVWQRDLAA